MCKIRHKTLITFCFLLFSLNSCFTSEKDYLAYIPRVTEEENAKVFSTDFTAPVSGERPKLSDDYVRTTALTCS